MRLNGQPGCRPMGTERVMVTFRIIGEETADAGVTKHCQSRDIGKKRRKPKNVGERQRLRWQAPKPGASTQTMRYRQLAGAVMATAHESRSRGIVLVMLECHHLASIFIGKDSQ